MWITNLQYPNIVINRLSNNLGDFFNCVWCALITEQFKMAAQRIVHDMLSTDRTAFGCAATSCFAFLPTGSRNRAKPLNSPTLVLRCCAYDTLNAHYGAFLLVKKGIPSPQEGYACLAHPAGFEPTACRLGGGRSILLSYGCMLCNIGFWLHCVPVAC